MGPRVRWGAGAGAPPTSGTCQRRFMPAPPPPGPRAHGSVQPHHFWGADFSAPRKDSSGTKNTSASSQIRHQRVTTETGCSTWRRARKQRRGGWGLFPAPRKAAGGAQHPAPRGWHPRAIPRRPILPRRPRNVPTAGPGVEFPGFFRRKGSSRRQDREHPPRCHPFSVSRGRLPPRFTGDNNFLPKTPRSPF